MLLLGAVLAGGRSQRFGTDKALALLPDGRSLLDHAIAALSPHVDAVALCGRRIEGMTCLADRPAPGMGPLGGLNAALRFALDEGYEAVITTGCDMPVFPAALALALIGEGPAILAGQQLAGYWPATLAPVLDAHFASAGTRSIIGWAGSLSPRLVTLPGPALPNINRPEELAAWTKDGRRA